MSLTFLSTPFAVLASILVVALTAVVSWLGWRRSGYAPRIGLLEALRTVIVGMVAVTFNQPEWLTQYVPTDKPTLLVLNDVSRSMETRDVITEARSAQDPQSRREWTESITWESTEELDIVVEEFSSTLTDAASATNIHAAMMSAMKNHENLRGIVLVSDGDWNVGDAPAAAANRLRVQNIPVYVAAAGSESRLPDIVVERFDVPTFGVSTKMMRLPFVISSSMPRDTSLEVVLSISNGEKLKQVVQIPAMGTVEDAISWRPMATGEFSLAFDVPKQSGELIEENNHRLVPISIREEAIRVLLIESQPRWEYRYLRNALERDPGVEVSCLLFHPGLSKVGGGRGYLAAFPETLEQLSEFDVVFLGDVGIEDNQLTTEQCRLIKGLVANQASGLILMPGLRGAHLSLGSTELDELYPVVLDPAQPRGWGARNPAQFELTESGRRSLLTKLDDSESENARLWETLPGFHWYAATLRAKAGTDVLATHKTEMGPRGRIPLLVTKTFGTGKVLFMGTDAAWRWRKGVEDKYHYRFWGQVARWMAYQRSIAQGEKMRLFYSPDRPLVDTVITLNANVMSSSGEPLQKGNVTVQAIAPSGESETLRLRANGDEWGLFTGSFHPKERGEYRMVLACRENGSSLETKLSVQGVERERIGQPVRIDVLEEIARISGGRMAKQDELAGVVAEIQDLPEPEPIVRRLRLWCHPIWAGTIVLLLGLFWSGRKMVGQI